MTNRRRPRVLIRGGGDLATGVGVRLQRAGFAVAVLEIPQPLAVRRLVAFAEAVYQGRVQIEGIQAVLSETPEEAEQAMAEGRVPVLVDPEAECRTYLRPLALVDGRMLKNAPGIQIDFAPLVIGLGPGFTAGVHCHAVVETSRGHHMGRVYWEGSALADTGIPELVSGHDAARVLRAPAEGEVRGRMPLGGRVRKGEVIVEVGGVPLYAAFDGALRGMVHDGLVVEVGDKIGDLDPRQKIEYCTQISDKSLAVGGGVLEALLSKAEIRRALGG